MAPTDGSDGDAILAQLAAAERRERLQAWEGLGQSAALADASGFLLRWADNYSRLPFLLALCLS